MESAFLFYLGSSFYTYPLLSPMSLHLNQCFTLIREEKYQAVFSLWLFHSDPSSDWKGIHHFCFCILVIDRKDPVERKERVEFFNLKNLNGEILKLHGSWPYPCSAHFTKMPITLFQSQTNGLLKEKEMVLCLL